MGWSVSIALLELGSKNIIKAAGSELLVLSIALAEFAPVILSPLGRRCR